VAEGEVEAAAARPAGERRRAVEQAERLGRQPAAAVVADRLVLESEALAQRERFGLRPPAA